MTDFCCLLHEAFHMNSVIGLTIKEVQVIVNPGGGEQGEGKDQVCTSWPHWSGLILCKFCVLLMGCGTAANRSDTSLLTRSVYQRAFRSPEEVPQSYPLRKHWYLPFGVRRNRSRTRAGSHDFLKRSTNYLQVYYSFPDSPSEEILFPSTLGLFHHWLIPLICSIGSVVWCDRSCLFSALCVSSSK